MTTATKFAGPAIQSVLSLVSQPAPAPELDFDPRTVMFTSFAEAIAWRQTLTDEQADYFSKIDRFVIALEPGRIVDITKKVPAPDERPHFYRCLSYIMLGCNLFGDISFNENFTQLKLNNRWNEKAYSTPT